MKWYYQTPLPLGGGRWDLGDRVGDPRTRSGRRAGIGVRSEGLEGLGVDGGYKFENLGYLVNIFKERNS